MKHKHAEVLHAFADGIECEYQQCDNWFEIYSLQQFDIYEFVRIKPEPQKEQYLYVYRHIDTSKTMMSPILMKDTSDWDYLGKVKVEK